MEIGVGGFLRYDLLFGENKWIQKVWDFFGDGICVRTTVLNILGRIRFLDSESLLLSEFRNSRLIFGRNPTCFL